LPIPYFHIVLTVSQDLREVALLNLALFYNLMFWAASTTLLLLARTPNGSAHSSA